MELAFRLIEVRAMNGVDVLVVDDDRPLCEALREVLTEAGYSVRCAYTADQACAMLERDGYGIVVSDWSLPGDGATVVRYVRQHLEGVPVVIISGEFPDDMTPIEGDPVAARLAKPVEARVLLETMRDVEGWPDRHH